MAWAGEDLGGGVIACSEQTDVSALPTSISTTTNWIIYVCYVCIFLWPVSNPSAVGPCAMLPRIAASRAEHTLQTASEPLICQTEPGTNRDCQEWHLHLCPMSARLQGPLSLKCHWLKLPWAHKGHGRHRLQRSVLIPNLPPLFLAITVGTEILIREIH